jgi:hypothetical protein
MMNGALNYNEAALMLTGFLSWQKTLTFPLRKGFWFTGFLGIYPRSVKTALADGLCNLGGNHSGRKP